MQLTVTLTKETPLELLLETSTYINNVAAILYGGVPESFTSGQASTTLSELVANSVDNSLAPELVASTNIFAAEMAAPKYTDNVIPMRPVESDPLEVDVDGYPWDARIHAAGRGKTATGQWRKRRNTPDEKIAQVEAELRNRLAARAARAPELEPVPLVVPAPTDSDVPLPPEPAILMPPAAEVVAPPLPPVEVALPPVAPPPAPVAPAAAAAITERSYDELLSLITDVLLADLITNEDVQNVLDQHDVKELADLAGATPAKVALVYNSVEEAAK